MTLNSFSNWGSDIFHEFSKQIGQLAKFCPYATIRTNTERTEIGTPPGNPGYANVNTFETSRKDFLKKKVNRKMFEEHQNPRINFTA